ncbi:hypothetical protein DYB36_000003 [Aphanomyces astaci]|uniref:Uncharacterized protein n=1 Tax=Aphanomyces astaci TaxID=112090 RepID=A0A397FAV4_APHAT|nr:hypothetical protein DYB36_000003 [Aphanomyces astaci]RHZ13481.1 hypothetical protein DYB31_000450 [Aphanomyces astaci]
MGGGGRQVSCGRAHTGAVSTDGDLYMWGCANGGRLGLGERVQDMVVVPTLVVSLARVLVAQVSCGNSHSALTTEIRVDRRVIEAPELLRAFHVAPYNLAVGKRARQSSVYNQQDADLAVDGNRSGTLHTCMHTQVWNRTDQPVDTSRQRDEFTSRLFPFWILVSEVPFDDSVGSASLKAGRAQSNASAQFADNHRLTEWVLPSTGTVGRYIRIQVKGKRYLHLAQVRHAICQSKVNPLTLEDNRSTSTHDHYLKAIQADPDNATILRQYDAYAKCFQLYGRGEALTHEKCRLCRAIRQCEVCEFYTSTPSSDLPLTTLGEKLGLAEATDVILSREPPRLTFDKRASTPATHKFAKVFTLSPKKLGLPFKLSPSKKDPPRS